MSKRLTDNQIIGMLKEAEAGLPVARDEAIPRR